MRLLFSLILACLLRSLSLSAQPLEGNIRYLVQHDYTKKMAKVDYISKQQREKDAYVWGGERSIWRVYQELWIKPGQSKHLDSQEKVKVEDERYSWRPELYFRYHDYDQKRTYHAEVLAGKTYLVEDSLPIPNWKIKNDLKEVAGHLCMNATYYDSVRQQRVLAWFALDMPHPGGPDRFVGLPGLVLEVDVNDGAMTYTADKIERRPLTTELDRPKKVKAKKVTQAQYDSAIRAHIAESRKLERVAFWSMRY